MKLIFFLLVSWGFSSWALFDLSQEELHFNARLLKQCGISIPIGLHDYSYGRDERRLYDNLHFEEASIMIQQIEKSCQINSNNISRLKKIKNILFKRASYGERKILFNKKGNLIFLVGRESKGSGVSLDQQIRQDLARILGVIYEPPTATQSQAQNTHDQASATSSSQKTIDQKISEINGWYMAEVKKLSNQSGSDKAKQAEELNKLYQEKLNAVTHP